MDTSKILAELHAQRERLNQAIAALEALNGTGVSRQLTQKTSRAVAPPTRKSAKKRVISAEARKRMADAQRRRWANHKKSAKAPAAKK